MNVLILTPDAVGSTLLQRVITVTMQLHDYDRPVINLHELTNGIMRYYSPDFQREVLGRHPDQWGYHQSLREVTDLLHTTDHYKTSRLAHYHIRNRQDSMADQVPFYRYLNENFFVIACQRENVFEHAMSWAINSVTRRLNVYSAQEKLATFLDLYSEGITVDPKVLTRALDDYKLYLQWCVDHFSVSSYFSYERHVPELERYILELPIFPDARRETWQQRFGMSFADWNLYRYLMSDIHSVALARSPASPLLQHIAQHDDATSTDAAWVTPTGLIDDYNKVSDPSWPVVKDINDYLALPQHIRQECRDQHGIEHHLDGLHLVANLARHLPVQHHQYLQQHYHNYAKIAQSIEHMRQLGIMLNAPPIKKQTMSEKIQLVKNFQECLDHYNTWCGRNLDVAKPLCWQEVQDISTEQQQQWQAPVTAERQLAAPTTGWS